MKYMLLVYWNETQRKSATKEQMAETFSAYMAYTEALKKAGAFLAGSGLQDSSTASVVRPEWQSESPEWTLCREQGAARRLLSHRGG